MKTSYLQLKEKNYSKVRDDFEILLRNRQEKFKFDIDNPSCTILCNHGFVSPIDLTSQIFQLGPPLMIESLGYLIFSRRQFPKELIPFKSNQLDVVEMLKIILPYFDKEKMKNAIISSHKKTEVKSFRNDKKGYNVPKEANYVVEIVGILRSWMPITYTITTETNCQKKFADIHIKYLNPETEESEDIEDIEDIERKTEINGPKYCGTMLELISNIKKKGIKVKTVLLDIF